MTQQVFFLNIFILDIEKAFDHFPGSKIDFDMKYSYLIVGAGFTGAVIAREIADKCNEPVLVIDRRNHVSGNAFDHND